MPVHTPHFAHSSSLAKHKLRPALFILLCLFFAVLLPACGDEDKAGQDAEQETSRTDDQNAGQDAGQAPGSTPEPAQDAKAGQQILVGTLQLPMPAPQGFERLEPDHPLYSKVALQSDETLLCVFIRPAINSPAQKIPESGPASSGERNSETGGPSAEPASAPAASPLPESAVNLSATLADETAGSVEFAGAPEDFDLLLATTLEKWLFSHFSLETFEAITDPWQKNSVVCNQDTLKYFVEAALSRLANTDEYIYKLGLIGHSRQQISFARIIKGSGADGQSRYFCAMNSLLYRNGKILGINSRVRIWNLAEVGPTIDRYIAYLHKLQALDNQLFEQPLSRQTLQRRKQVAANDAG